jgi:hypothetical protein
MLEEHKTEETQKYAGLTTKALADPGQQTGLRKDLELLPTATELPGKHCCAGSVEAVADSSAGVAGTATCSATGEQATPLFSAHEAQEFRARWDTIQGTFVDDPRRAVEQADSLVAGTMKRLAEVFAAERSKLEGQWESDKTVSTEDLRLALRRYRSFFGRLLSV